MSFIWHCRALSMNFLNFKNIRDKSNILLKHLLLTFLKEDNAMFENYFKDVEMGIDYLDDTFDTCHFILSHCAITENDSTLFAAQSTYLLICYICFLHGDKILSTYSLELHLIIFIRNISEVSVNPFLCKLLLFLIAIIVNEKIKTTNMISTEIKQASLKLKKAILQLENPSLTYTHHKDVLLWTILFKDEDGDFLKFIIYEWLKNCKIYKTADDEESSDMEFLFENIFKDTKLQKNFIELFAINSIEDSIDMSSFLKIYLQKLKIQDRDCGNNTLFRIIEILVNKLPYILVKCFMNINSKENIAIEMKIKSLLGLLVWCQQNNNLSISTSQDDLKLIFQALFSKIVCQPIISQLEESININDDVCTTAALAFLSGLIIYYSKYNLKIRQHRVVITMNQMLHWLQDNTLKSHLYILQILKELINYNFEHPIIFLKKDYILANDDNSLFLKKDDFRLFFLAILNIIVKMNDIVSLEAVYCLKKLLEYLKNKNSFLGDHLMSLPWLKIVIETRSIDSRKENDEISWRLLLLCLKSSMINESLVKHVVYNAMQLASINVKEVNTFILKEIIHELCTGTYNKFLQSDVKSKLQEILK
ncbi:uncharacterized protein LOC111642210 isoform X2 [Centruroides sculpturatus]|uniref:uncharacterized protein LOC111642210 isoform X2 n=1 Tax=Centruroides sculpturatus TaxID=218467 RepID=UPI000C6E3DA2|nr:uncharacterized protein LOC111642210 isoform X2 [Centruroides sculpturatus]